METLLSLREKAQKLEIENYSVLSKEKRKRAIENAEKNLNQSAVVETDMSEVSDGEKQEVAEKEVAGEVEEISAEEAAKLGKEQKVKKPTKKELKAEERAKKAAEKEAAKKAKEEEKAAKKAEREAAKATKKAKAPKKIIRFVYTPKGDAPEKLGPTSQKVYDEILKGEGLSVYQYAKKCDTYFSIVDKVVSKYFDVEKKEIEPDANAEAAE